MKKAISARVGRLIAGGVNAMIEAVENATPEMVMEQALREVDAAIDEVRSELGRVLAGKHLASKRLLEENRKHEDLAEQIELALAQAREDLAEAAIARQFDIEAQLPVLESALADAAHQQKELEGYVAALAARRREMVTELEQFRATQKLPASTSTTSGGADIGRRVGAAESKFDGALKSATGVPGVTGTSSSSDAGKLAELEQLARQNRIQERLAQVKARTAK